MQPSFRPNRANNGEQAFGKDQEMSQAQIQPHEQNLLGQYREIGPAVLVAALMNSSHKSRKIQIKVPCNSILADKKTV